MEITFKYKKYKLKLELNSKITVITGDSATGKSTLRKAIPILDTLEAVKISDGSYELITEIPKKGFDLVLKGYTKAVYVIDEHKIDLLLDTKIASLIKANTDCYFVIIGRSNINTLNLDINNIYELQSINGEVQLIPFIKTVDVPYIGENKPKITHCLIEDSGQAMDWVQKLLSNSDIEVITSSGKEKFCDKINELLYNNSKFSILLLFDSISFGALSSSFRKVAELYSNQLYMLRPYKSWEYLMLKTNMFSKDFIHYTLDQEIYEEEFYEEQLQKLSNSTFGTIKHNGGGSIVSKCYTEPCCYYRGKQNLKCTFRIGGEDKFVALLDGTEFNVLLLIAGRK